MINLGMGVPKITLKWGWGSPFCGGPHFYLTPDPTDGIILSLLLLLFDLLSNNADITARAWRVDGCARAYSIINGCERRSIFTPFKAVKVMVCPYSSQNSTSMLRGRYRRSEKSEN